MIKAEEKKVIVGIDPISILLGIAVLLGVYLVWQLNVLFIVLFVAFIIASTLKPVVNMMENKYKIHRGASIVIILAIGITLTSLLSYMVVGNLSRELEGISINNVVTEFVNKLDSAIPGDQSSLFLGKTATSTEVIDTDSTNILSQLDAQSLLSGTNYIVDLFGKTVGTFFLFFTMLMVSFYMLSRKANVYDGVLNLLPKRKRKDIEMLLGLIEKKLGAWLTAQLYLMAFVGVLTFFGLAIPRFFVPGEYFSIGRFAVTMAVLAGIFEVIPNIGPTITMIVAIILSIATGGDTFLGQTIYVAVYFLLIQQVENTYIVPKIMKQAVGLDPIITILSVMGAYTLMGPIGAIIVIPIIAIVLIAVEFYSGDKKALMEA